MKLPQSLEKEKPSLDRIQFEGHEYVLKIYYDNLLTEKQALEKGLEIALKSVTDIHADKLAVKEMANKLVEAISKAIYLDDYGSVDDAKPAEVLRNALAEWEESWK